jgi:hypothetical protein
MGEDLDPGTELDQLLARLEQLDEQLDLLQLDKKQLRDRIAELMRQQGRDRLKVEGLDRTTTLRLTRRTTVKYDEELLRERLGERYGAILEPDMKRVRKHLPEIEHLFEPVLDLVGAPSREKVEETVLAGTLAAGDFAGAFEKTTTDVLYVRRQAARPAPEAAGVDDEDAPY